MVLNFNDPRTNWKFITIVAIFAFFVEGGVLLWSLNFSDQSLSRLSENINIKQDTSLQHKGSFFKEKVDTSDWKAYRNGNFSFEYPQDWKLEIDKSIDSARILTLDSPAAQKIHNEIESGKSIYGVDSTIVINYYKNISEEPQNKLNKLAKSLDEFVSKNPSISDAQRISFAGYPAFKMIQGGYSLYYTVMVDKKGEIYEISFSSDSLMEIEETVLSTFRFVE